MDNSMKFPILEFDPALRALIELSKVIKYGGDTWDSRCWQSKAEIRENLFWLSADICVTL